MSKGSSTIMQIESDKVVLLKYRLSNEAGIVLEDALKDDPVALLMGHGNVIRGLERALAGHEAGDQFDVVVEPLDGYGLRKKDQFQRLSKKYFANPKKLKPGMQTIIRTEDGERRVTVQKIGGKVIDVDLNHPLAGQNLNFFVKIVEVRDATAAELSHGHAHADGHDHH
jgi:FKBP-type peptidyl-prolyl cis-trans isomerase SlyD